MSKIKSYVKESYDELLHKTTWPTWSELNKTSVLVAVASIIIALLIWSMDKIIVAALKFFYDLF